MLDLNKDIDLLKYILERHGELFTAAERHSVIDTIQVLILIHAREMRK